MAFGTLQIGDGATPLASIANSAVTVNAGATLAINLAPNETFVNNVTDNGAVNETAGNHSSRDTYSSREMCQETGLSASQLAELVSYGLLVGKGTGESTLYNMADLAIAQAAAGFMQHGVEGRHLRAWRQAAGS